MRRDEEHILRTVLRTDIPGKRKTGRAKTRRKDVCQRDMKCTGLRVGEEMVGSTWSRKITSHTMEKAEGKKKRHGESTECKERS